ncbi:cytochrome P450 2A3-like [Pelobates fuscus]|uniref:cytochrome P450 2A3-like n=1 Tax=Pelobates fuscus TaxID=191477 RepID=UPI002FE47575
MNEIQKCEKTRRPERMLGTTTVLLALLLGLLLLHLIKLRITSAQLPPGPTPVPFFGNLWTLKFQLHHKTIMQLAKTYGNIITIWIGQTPIIVLHGYESIREGLIAKSEQLSMRAERPFFKYYANGRGIIVANGHNWKQQRQLGIQILRNLGLGSKGMEWKIHLEAQRLVDIFTALKGRAHDPKYCLMNTMSNVIAAVSFGHHFSLEDQLFHDLVESSDSVTSFFGTRLGQLYDSFPWLMHHIPGPQQTTFKHLQFLKCLVMQEIKSHQRNPSTEPQDIIDFYLEHISKTKDDPSSPFNEMNLMQIVLDIFLAGSETLTSTFLWGLLFMVLHPDVQAKVQKELDAHFETYQELHYENRKEVPYTYAVIHEIQRCANVAPVGLPRQCAQDVKIKGYQLKKGTVIVTCLASALCDPNYWKFPNDFCPSNFLDEHGNFQSKEAFLPFSTGQRICLGRQLAMMELFIFFTHLLHAFTFQLPQGVTEVNMNGILGTTFRPHPYQICAIPR